MNEQVSEYRKKILTIPNILSVFRVCLIPVCVWLYCLEENYAGATCVLILSGLTDVADGYIARHFHMISDLGKALDPVADKLTQLAMLICLVTRFPNMMILVVLLFVKETIMGVTGLLVIHNTGIVISAVWHGKINTALLYFMVFVHFIWVNIPAVISNLLISACMVMMLLSCILYVIQNIHLLRNKK